MPFPEWLTAIRPHQQAAIIEACSKFSKGVPIVMIDAPTGSGKTLIGEMVRQTFNWRAVYLCSTLSLQDQFVHDFPYAALLRGRANYPTADTPQLFPHLTASDCTKETVSGPECSDCDPNLDPDYEYRHCRWCHPVSSCLYEIEKAAALRSPLACSNVSYFLYESNFVGSLAHGRDLIIIDEADLLEDQLLSFISVSITPHMQREYGISMPTKKTVADAWVEWAGETEAKVRLLKNQRKSDDLAGIRRRNALARLHTNLLRLTNPKTGIAEGNWVYTGYERGTIEFKPINVAPYATEFLWRHAPRFLLMSATMISFSAMADSLGMDL